MGGGSRGANESESSAGVRLTLSLSLSWESYESLDPIVFTQRRKTGFVPRKKRPISPEHCLVVGYRRSERSNTPTQNNNRNLDIF